VKPPTGRLSDAKGAFWSYQDPAEGGKTELEKRARENAFSCRRKNNEPREKICAQLQKEGDVESLAGRSG